MRENWIKEIIEQNEIGYGYGITVFNELFLGNITSSAGLEGIEFFKNTEENMRMIKGQYDLYKDMI